MVDEGVQKRKMGFAREPEKAKWLSQISHSSDSLIYSHGLPTLVSQIQEQTVALLQGHQDDKSRAMKP